MSGLCHATTCNARTRKQSQQQKRQKHTASSRACGFNFTRPSRAAPNELHACTRDVRFSLPCAVHTPYSARDHRLKLRTLPVRFIIPGSSLARHTGQRREESVGGTGCRRLFGDLPVYRCLIGVNWAGVARVSEHRHCLVFFSFDPAFGLLYPLNTILAMRRLRHVSAPQQKRSCSLFFFVFKRCLKDVTVIYIYIYIICA